MELRIPSLGALWTARRQLSPQEAQQQRIDARLRAIERQGTGGVHFGHALAYLLVFTFSVGALIALAGDALRTFIQQAQAGAMDIPSLISFVVSFVLVFAMDTAMVRAAATVRMLRQRHQTGVSVHVAVIAVVCVVESATYLYMSYEYDHPGRQVVVWTILAVRAVIAPIVAVYLSLGRQLPVSARDINTQVEVVTGRGVLVDMTRIADDPAATTERKVALYQASAIMDATDEQRLARIIEAERATRGELTAPAPQPAPVPLPTPQTPPPAANGRALSNHDLRRLRLQRDMETLETADTDDADDDNDWGAYSGADDLGAYDDDLPRLRQPHVTTPRGHFSNHANAKSGSSAARISPRFSEMVIEAPVGRTARKEDSVEARKVMNYLDKHPGAQVAEVIAKTKVGKPTVRRYYTAWIERNKRMDMPAAPFTQEMPAISPDQISELAESM